MIGDDKIAEIKQAARIAEFIRPYVDLRRSGRNLMGLCPFHAEKSPSFSVNDEAGFFHCFGCGVGGDVFKFLMMIENLEFPEALEKVAATCGIEVPRTRTAGGSRSELDAMLAASAAASRYWRLCLTRTPVGEPVLAYLAERGLGADAIEGFSLGAAPASGDGLVRWLAKENIDARAAEKAGLIGRNARGFYDKFRARLMFPIRDGQGRTLGFGGRILGGEGAKYINSSDSPIYHKSRVLYGLFAARPAARAAGRPARFDYLLLVEGYMDVIALHEAGMFEAVATCGTALTVDQARLMKRHGADVITLFDGDQAGRTAAARAFPVLVEAGLWPRAVFLPDGEDPDTFVRRHGRAELERHLAAARPLAETWVASLGAGDGAEDKARVGRELAEVLAKVSDPFELDFLVQRACLWTGISEQALRQALRRGPTPRPVRPATESPSVDGPDASDDADGPAPARAAARIQGRVREGAPGPEELLMTLAVADPAVVARLPVPAIVEAAEEEPWKSALLALIAGGEQEATPADVLERMPERARERVTRRLVDDAIFASPDHREVVLRDSSGGLERRARSRRSRKLVEELRRREELGEDVLDSARRRSLTSDEESNG